MSKFNLNLVKGQSYFCSGRLSVGVYVQKDGVILIDSGIDRDNAKGIDLALKNANLQIKAIINTHHHPDHCGGNNYFQKQYPDLRIFATQFEKIFIENPFMQPLCFCSGAAPFAELRNKYLEAEPSIVTHPISSYHDQEIDIDGEQFKIVTLPGHTYGSIGIITPDNVFYSGDSIFGDETFNKHGVLFYTNIHDTLLSFEKLSSLSIESCVLYHGGHVDEIGNLAKKHATKIIATKNLIASMIHESSSGISIDHLTQSVIKACQVPENILAFTLTKTCVNAYITQLSMEKNIALDMKDGLLTVVTKK